MAASLYDSAIYRDLVTHRATAQLFTDSAEIRAMLITLGALAKAQGAHGVIPEVSAAAIHRASLEVQIDPAGLASETGRSAVVVPALVSAFRDAMQAPEHGQWVHYGATSQDIMETGLKLRLRQVLALAEGLLADLMTALADQAEAHADLPMAGRTYGQVATSTSFGAVAAGWGAALPDLTARLGALRAPLLTATLGGAAGTLSAMPPEVAAKVRVSFAEGLDIAVPIQSAHPVRQPMTALASWAAEMTGTLSKMGEDLILMTQTGIEEVSLPTSGGSSTMPQKQNPVMPSLLMALSAHVRGLSGVMTGALCHRQQRDGAAWIAEWLALPQICLGLMRSLELSVDLARGVTPRPDAMAAHIDDGSGLIYAEALQFALTTSMPRPDAQAEVKRLCAEVRETGQPLAVLAKAAHPEADLMWLFRPESQLGLAPSDARAFAKAARAAAAGLSDTP